MKKRIMRYLDHVETNEYGYEVLVLACGHRFTAHQTGRRPTAKQHRQWQWCTECSREASDSEIQEAVRTLQQQQRERQQLAEWNDRAGR